MKHEEVAKYHDLGGIAPTYRRDNLPTGPDYFYTVAESGRGAARTNARIITQLYKHPPSEKAPHLYRHEWGWTEEKERKKHVAYGMVNKRAFNEPIYVHYAQGVVKPSSVDLDKIMKAMKHM